MPAVVLALLVLLALAVPAQAQDDPQGTPATVIADDGTTLAVDVFRPPSAAEDARTPVAMVIGPYFDDRLLPTDGRRGLSPWARDPDLLAAGYTVVQASLRGFGRSRGCLDFGGDKDLADVRALVEWAAEQPFSTGRVGVIGNSYEAWAGIMALAARPRGLAAVVAYSPIISGARAFGMNGVHYALGWHATAPGYVASDLRAPAYDLDPAGVVARTADAAPNAPCYAERLALSEAPDPALPYWRERDLIERAASSEVPVFWTHGFIDANTKPDNILDVWSRLRGPKRAWFGQFLHGGPPDDQRPDGSWRLGGEVRRWLDRWVARRSADTDGDPPVFVQDPTGNWRPEASWPPADATAAQAPVLAGQYLDAPGNWGQQDEQIGVTLPGQAERAPEVPTGVGTWTFTTPLPHAAHLAGVPRLEVQLTAPAPAAHLVGLLYDVAPDGTAQLISRGARVLDTTATRAVLDLYPNDRIIEPGHRLGLLLSGADDGWWDPGRTGRPVLIAGGSFSAPFLRRQRTDFDPGIVYDFPLFGTRPDQRIRIPAETIAARTTPWTPPARQDPAPTAR